MSQQKKEKHFYFILTLSIFKIISNSVGQKLILVLNYLDVFKFTTTTESL